MKKILVFLLTLLPFLTKAQGPQTSIPVPVNSSGSQTRPALLYLPNDYNSTSTSYPLLIFMHGAGEASATPNLSKLYTTWGPPYLIAQNQWPVNGFVNPADGQTYKFIVLSPQNTGWSTEAAHLDHIINYMKSTYRVDANRIYLTGLSAGGDGAVRFMAGVNSFSGTSLTVTNRPAASVVMSAATGTPQQSWVNRIVTDNIHVWGLGDHSDIHGINTHLLITGSFSGNNGPTPPALGSLGRWSEYNCTSPSDGHGCWNTYYNPNYRETVSGQQMSIYEWMLQYTRDAGVPGENQPPTVNITTIDQTITLPASSITGVTSTSSDPDGSIVSRQWSVVTSPVGSSPSFSAPTSATTDITNLTVAGAYQFRLVVTDDDGATASDVINVQVNPQVSGGTTRTAKINLYANSDPEATTGWVNWNISSLSPLTNITFSDGTTSTIGATLSTQTGWGDNNSGYGSGSNTMGIPDKVLRYMSINNTTTARTLTINNLDNSKTYSFRFFASRLNQTSISNKFTINGTSAPNVVVGNNFTNVVTFNNIFPTSGQIVVTMEGINGGTYLNGFEIIETTGGGTPTDNPPVANAGNDQIITLPTNTTTLDGSASTDDHLIVSYSWARISGPNTPTITGSTTATPQLSGLVEGTYVYRLTVTDDASPDAQTDTDDVTITVNAAANEPPVADAGGDKSITFPETSVPLNGTASNDPDGTIATYLWEVISAPAGATAPTQTKYAIPGGRSFTITPDGQGYRVINGGSYIGGDTIYLSGYFKAVAIENIAGSNGNHIVITNKANETLIIGDSLWSGGAWAHGLAIRNCRYLEIVGNGGKDKFKIIGSNSDAVSNGAPVKNAYFNLAATQLSYGMAIHHITIRHGGTGIFGKTEVSTTNSNTWYPNVLPYWRIHDVDMYNTFNEGIYIGHTATYWDIQTNQPYYPSNPSDLTAQNNPARYKIPTKLSDVKIYNNYLHTIGNDAIQTAATDDLEIYNNEITDWAYTHQQDHNGGFLIGGRVKGFSVHDNYAHDGWGEMIQVYAEGGASKIPSIKNNLLVNNQAVGISIRGTNNFICYIDSNTLAYIGGQAVRINGFWNSPTPDTLRGNILAQPMRNGGTIQASSYIYLENTGAVYEGTASPLKRDNKKFATVLAAQLNELDYFKPNTGSSAIGYGYIRNTNPTSGSASYNILSPTSASTTITGLIIGTYGIRLTVTDNNGASSFDDITVTVNNSQPGYFRIKPLTRLRFLQY
jgi:hypothetical protein